MCTCISCSALVLCMSRFPPYLAISSGRVRSDRLSDRLRRGNGPRERPAGPALAGEAAVGGPRRRIRRLIHRCLRPTRAHRRPPRLPYCVPFRYRLLPGRGGRQHAVRGSPPQQPTQQGDELLPRPALSAAGGDAALPRAPRPKGTGFRFRGRRASTRYLRPLLLIPLLCCLLMLRIVVFVDCYNSDPVIEDIYGKFMSVKHPSTASCLVECIRERHILRSLEWNSMR